MAWKGSINVCLEVLKGDVDEYSMKTVRQLLCQARDEMDCLLATSSEAERRMKEVESLQMSLEESMSIIDSLRDLVREQQAALRRPETGTVGCQTEQTLADREALALQKKATISLERRCYQAELDCTEARKEIESLERIVDHLEASLGQKDAIIDELSSRERRATTIDQF